MQSRRACDARNYNEYERVCEYTLELIIKKLELNLQDVGPPGPGFGHPWSMGSIHNSLCY